MTQLNRHAAEQMEAFGVEGCTDVTGNGFLGHAFELAEASNVTLEIVAADVPALPGTIDLIKKGHLTAGGHSNRVLIQGNIEWNEGRDDSVDHFLLDPQTSGGLLISVRADRCDELFATIKEVYNDAAIVGRVTERRNVLLKVT